MERVLEPELMNDPAQAEAYAGADFAASNQAFVEAFVRLSGPFAGVIGDLGCGDGEITIRLAQALPGAGVVGIDGAAAMLEHAHRRVVGAGLQERVGLERRVLPDPELRARFDAVVSNSLLHHLEDASVFWDAVLGAAKPGAHVLVMDLRRPADETELAALVRTYADDALPLLRRDFAASLRAAFTADEVRRQVSGTALEVAEVDDRYVRVWGRK